MYSYLNGRMPAEETSTIRFDDGVAVIKIRTGQD